jgi:hypothetical protein
MRIRIRSLNLLFQVLFTVKVKVFLIPAFFQVIIFKNQQIIKNKFNHLTLVSDVKIKNKVAIIAIFPEDTVLYSDSLLNLLTGAIQSGKTPIVISNGPIPEKLRKIILDLECVVLLRKNHGRDFAAYKCAILWLFQNPNAKTIESISLINDTLTWRNSSHKFFSKMDGSQWGGMFLNLADKTHVNSFIMHFGPDVISNTEFKKFWEKYLPSQYKRHAIHQGEIKLSTILLKQGFLPDVIVDSKYLKEILMNVSRSKLVKLSELPSVEIGPSLDHFFKSETVNDYLKAKNEIEKASTAVLRNLVEDRLLRVIFKDSPHSLGLHMYILDDFPLKRDLYKYYSLPEILNVLSFTDSNFAALVVEDLLAGF